MHSEFYKKFLEDVEQIDLDSSELSYFVNEDGIDDDLFYEAKIEFEGEKYRIRVSEDYSPRTPTVSNYKVEIAEKKPLKIDDDGYTDWRRVDTEKYIKRSENIFPRTLKSYLEDEIGITFDEEQEKI
jgi:hypothetical protein